MKALFSVSRWRPLLERRIAISSKQYVQEQVQSIPTIYARTSTFCICRLCSNMCFM